MEQKKVYKHHRLRGQRHQFIVSHIRSVCYKIRFYSILGRSLTWQNNPFAHESKRNNDLSLMFNQKGPFKRWPPIDPRLKINEAWLGIDTIWQVPLLYVKERERGVVSKSISMQMALSTRSICIIFGGRFWHQSVRKQKEYNFFVLLLLLIVIYLIVSEWFSFLFIRLFSLWFFRSFSL